MEISGEKSMNLFYAYCPSPIGRLVLTSDGKSLTGLYTGLYTGLLNEEAKPDDDWQLNDDVFPFAEEFVIVVS